MNSHLYINFTQVSFSLCSRIKYIHKTIEECSYANWSWKNCFRFSLDHYNCMHTHHLKWKPHLWAEYLGSIVFREGYKWKMKLILKSFQFKFTTEEFKINSSIFSHCAYLQFEKNRDFFIFNLISLWEMRIHHFPFHNCN